MMTKTKELVITEAMQLSEADKIDVIEKLSESLNSKLSVAAEWDDEIDRRLANAAAGSAEFIPWEVARKTIAGDVDASKD